MHCGDKCSGVETYTVDCDSKLKMKYTQAAGTLVGLSNAGWPGT